MLFEGRNGVEFHKIIFFNETDFIFKIWHIKKWKILSNFFWWFDSKGNLGLFRF